MEERGKSEQWVHRGIFFLSFFFLILFGDET